MNGWLVVFAKDPQPGRVKTRLSPPFSPAAAAAFYRCLLADVLDESAAAAELLGLDAVLAVDPPGSAAEMASEAPASFRAIAQAAGDLGERMGAVAGEAAAAGAAFALLRGSDSPCLARATLRQAVESLARADLVIGPDRDGGYDLVGLGPRALDRAASGRLFDHPMSHAGVLRETLARAHDLRVHLLETGFDVDGFDDLRLLAEARAAGTAISCPRSLAFLDAHGLWPSPRAISKVPVAGSSSSRP